MLPGFYSFDLALCLDVLGVYHLNRGADALFNTSLCDGKEGVPDHLVVLRRMAGSWQHGEKAAPLLWDAVW